MRLSSGWKLPQVTRIYYVEELLRLYERLDEDAVVVQNSFPFEMLNGDSLGIRRTRSGSLSGPRGLVDHTNWT